MNIDILKDRRVGDIKKEFTSKYSFLKLEFFDSRPQKKKDKKPRPFLSDDVLLTDVAPQMRAGKLSVTDSMKVSELEHRFKKDYLLNVQVFRRSGNIWLETSATDDWTLAQQNSHGQEITATCNPAEAADESDYELMRGAD